jgi:(2R)-sulfolactate sulfo-lyase subunit alpha
VLDLKFYVGITPPNDSDHFYNNFLMTPQTSQTSAHASLLRISPKDNVLVLTSTLVSGSEIHVSGVTRVFDHDLALGHKIAACDIKKGEKIFKCHFPIGSAKVDIPMGEHVHLHNMQSDYLPTYDRGETL